MTPFPSTFPVNEEAIGAINEAAIVANKALTISYSYFFIPCFTVSVTLSIITSDFSSDFMILRILSISSVKMNKVIPFTVLTVVSMLHKLP